MRGQKFPVDTPTTFKMHKSDSKFYTIGAAWFLLENRALAERKYTDYFTAAQNQNFPKVAFFDTKNLLAYLTGATPENDQIEPSMEPRPPFVAPPTTSAQGVVDAQQTAEDDDLPEAREEFRRHIDAERGVDQGEGKAKRQKLLEVSDVKETTNPFVKRSLKIVAKISQRERLLRDRHSVLQCYTKNADFSSTLRLLEQVKRNEEIRAKQPTNGSAHASDRPREAVVSVPVSVPKAVSDPRAHIKRPIILVPNAVDTPISLLNIKDFLESNRYVSVEEQQSKGIMKEEPVRIRRMTSKNEGYTYDVYDTPANLQERDWKRVACVFVLGPKWQFRDFKYKDPTELFEKVLGVHFYFEHTDVPPTIKGWNVKKLELSRNNRHRDAPLVLDFWRHLDHFLKAHRPELFGTAHAMNNKK
eukprot:c1257_g1_i1.p1 GENE.c1257_g1_i1~~c1257_g1_i1.p1  ORF type:complete len:451 (-),score=93.44 c1257_g1_i1:9-1253(-)